MDTVDAVRLATILDCEGWITIQSMNSPGQRGVCLVLTLGVGNTNPILTDYLKDSFGGSIYKTCRSSDKHKDYYTWRLNSNKAKALLEAALPYMMLKREQANLAIHFQETMHSKNSYNEPCTPQYIEYMQSLKKKMNQLNRKGKTLSPATTERDDTLDLKEVGEATV